MKRRARGTLAGLLVTMSLVGTVMCVHAAGLETPAHLPIDLRKIFAFFFLMLGPLKILGPFVQMTQGADERLCRQLAVRAFIIATITVLTAGLAGEILLGNFGVSLNALILGGGSSSFWWRCRPCCSSSVPMSRAALNRAPRR